MSTTRKPKPPDKGAPPEHKPSRKVALEEVMRSLQDLVSNELAIEPAKQPDETAAHKTGKSRTASKRGSAPGTPPPETETASAGTTSEIESIALESVPDVAATTLPTPEPHAASMPAIPAGGLQQELPYLEPQSPTPGYPQPGGTEPDSLPAVDDTAAADNKVPSDAVAPPLAEATPAPPEEVNWDDIPVLEEAVEMLEATEANEAGRVVGGPVATNLPPADAARRLAIQVAARLNVELRKSGQAGLSSDIITRLARLLQEALAKGALNMENTTVNKASSTEGGSAENAGAVFRPPPDKH
jgi:hypothetical protein